MKNEDRGFFHRVYAVVATIPPGKVMTYGQISRFLDNACSARYVGYAMASAPDGLACHRVVNRLGEMAGGHIFGGATRQRELLEAEGAVFRQNGRLDLSLCLYEPDTLWPDDLQKKLPEEQE